MLWLTLLLYFVGLIILMTFVYIKFFRNARPIDAQNLNAIHFGKTIEYIYPVEDNQIRLTGLELHEDELPQHHLEGWQKIDSKKQNPPDSEKLR